MMKAPLRYTPLFAAVLAVSACSLDTVSEPVVPDDLLVTAEAGKKNGQGDSQIIEPSRFIQNRLYAPGSVYEFGAWNDTQLFRSCFLNSYEDRDGDDFRSDGPGGGYWKEHINEKDGFVLVRETRTLASGAQVSRVTHIGRSTWDAEVWFDSRFDDGKVRPTFVNSKGQGVVVPIRYDLPFELTFPGEEPSDPEMAELLIWLDNVRDRTMGGPYEPGSHRWLSEADWLALPLPRPAPVADEIRDGVRYVMVAAADAPGVDLLNDPLGVIPIHPDPAKVGTVGRAVGRLATLMRRYEDELVGVECTALYSMTGLTPAGDPIYGWVQANDIVFKKTWPKQLNRTF